MISRDTSFVWTLEWGKTDLEIHSSCCLLSRPGDPDVVRSFISRYYVCYILKKWWQYCDRMTGWLAVWSMVSTIYIYFLSCSEMNGSVQFALKMRWRPSNILDASTVYLYRCHNPTTLRKNLQLNQKGVMNQLLASIWLMNDLRLIWIQSVSMCSQFCRSQSNAIYTAYGVKL